MCEGGFSCAEWPGEEYDVCLEIHIGRPLNTDGTDTTTNTASNELTSNGVRTVTFIPVGKSWQTFNITRNIR